MRLGATKDGIIKGIDLHTLSNTGAYGEHGPTTVGDVYKRQILRCKDTLEKMLWTGSKCYE